VATTTTKKGTVPVTVAVVGTLNVDPTDKEAVAARQHWDECEDLDKQLTAQRGTVSDRWYDLGKELTQLQASRKLTQVQLCEALGKPASAQARVSELLGVWKEYGAGISDASDRPNYWAAKESLPATRAAKKALKEQAAAGKQTPARAARKASKASKAGTKPGTKSGTSSSATEPTTAEQDRLVKRFRRLAQESQKLEQEVPYFADKLTPGLRNMAQSYAKATRDSSGVLVDKLADASRKAEKEKAGKAA